MPHTEIEITAAAGPGSPARTNTLTWSIASWSWACVAGKASGGGSATTLAPVVLAKAGDVLLRKE
ncbi:hypothetical protein GCM10010518_54910 [Kitasatospora cinereorecta]